MAYLPLSTANLPDPAIDPAQGSSPADYFNTVLWTGDGTSGRSITTGHQPDFVWTKERNSAINHIAQNSISGTGVYLHPNTTAAEQSATTLITSFDSDGFTIGNSGSINGSSDTYVAWSWKANGSGVSNTDGSITSTVSANTTSGFSLIKWTGNGTIGHGLDQAPEMFIVKIINTAGSWWVWHKDLSNTSAGYLQLNSTNGESSNTSVWRNSYPATATTIDVNTSYLNYSTDNYLAYCFHSVEGFSKFGSYSGTDSADGPFIYTGFRPSLVIVKCTTNADDWCILDSERDSYNVADALIKANGADAELEYTSLDMLSNGFKLRVTNSYRLNKGGASFIYMAFAENPFKYSNAR